MSEQRFDALRRRWAEEARSSGRDEDACALEGHDDLADDLADAEAGELLAAFRADVEREFAIAAMRAEPEAPQW
jgi:hypothetical protein